MAFELFQSLWPTIEGLKQGRPMIILPFLRRRLWQQGGLERGEEAVTIKIRT